MNALEQYARELVNISYSDEESIPTPTQFSTLADKASPKSQQSVLRPSNKSVKKKSTKKTLSVTKQPTNPRDKKRQATQQLEDLKQQLEQSRAEIEKLQQKKQELKTQNQKQTIIITQLQAKLDQCQSNQMRTHQQLNEQIDVTRQALRQASDAQITLESSKSTYILQLQQEETHRLQLKEDMETTYLKQMEQKRKEAIQDVERRYDHRIGLLTKEIEQLRLENIELHKKLMNTKDKKQYLQQEVEQIKQKFF